MNKHDTNARNLGTLVTFNPLAVRGDETLSDLAIRLEQSGFHHWPVVDEQRRLIGIVSDADIARNVAARRAAENAFHEAGTSEPELVPVTALDIMSQRVVHIDIQATPQQALKQLVVNDVQSLPVVEEQRLVGIVTSTDFLRELSLDELPAGRDPVSRHMTKTNEPIEVAESLEQARLELMSAGVRYLPVTKAECPLGVISQRMLRKAKCRQMLQESLHDRSPDSITLMHLVKSAPNIKPGDRLAKAAALMVDAGVRAVAVVNQARSLLGVISEDDILRAVLRACEGADEGRPAMSR